ncbi:MAG TPA: hypothetical protein VFR34_14130, partial [Paracoccaceae bacterium]|nr:hypothetical protein [Paracoccaceae bacterium]
MMNRRHFLHATAAALAVAPFAAAGSEEGVYRVTYFDARSGSRSRDVAFAPDGSVWYCGQGDGTLTRLDPDTGELFPVELGPGAAPHGVVLGPDGAFWITEGGQNAIARLEPRGDAVKLLLIPLPREFARANLNTGVFDQDGIYWFTGQRGVLGRVDPATGRLDAWEAPGGRGPYGITVTPSGEVWYASLAGSHIARIDRESRQSEIVTPPTPGQGARRVWSDSRDRIWLSAWNSGQVSRYDPADGSWREWKLPGGRPRAY